MRSRILAKNLITVLLPLLLSVGALGILSMAIIFQFIESDMKRTNSNLLNSCRYNIELIMRDLDLYSHNFSIDPGIISKTKELMSSDFYSYDMMQNVLFIRNFIDTPVNTQPYLHSAYIYYYGYPKMLCTDSGLVNLDEFYDRDWVSELSEQHPGFGVWFEPRSVKRFAFEPQSTDVISINCKLLSTGKTRGEGLLTLNLRADYMYDMLNGLVSYKNQSILVVDAQNQVVFRGGRELALSPEQLTEICGRASDYFLDEVDGINYRVYKTYSPRYDFSVVSMLPSSINYGLASRLVSSTLLVIVLVIVAGVLIAYTTTRKSCRQVLKIIDILDQYERTGEYPGMIANPVDEYDLIVCNILKTFIQNNQMRIQLTERKYKMDLYELKALQVQINPHFLYNALETINWKSMEASGGYSTVNEMIENLSSILKYCLSSAEEQILLEKEIQYTKCYMSIQNIRYNNQFSLIWEYDEDVLTHPVLKLLFQPLIENSINHGIRHRPDSGLIKVRIHKRGDSIRIGVIDNGVGMDQQKLRAVRHSLERQWQDDLHIGLINTNQRLRLLYGDRYTIRIYSKQGWGTALHFSIPAVGSQEPPRPN